jgi:ABC-2 type transport system ATP-binding protein
VTFGYGKRPLFEGLDLVVRPGSTVGLLGLNGAGKTSLLKLGAGALFPAAGRVKIFGRESRRREASLLADVCFVPEDPWAPALTPAGWLSRYGVFRPRIDIPLFDSLMKEFSLDSGQKVSKMSYGQRNEVRRGCGPLQRRPGGIPGRKPTTAWTSFQGPVPAGLAMAASEERIFIVSTHQARDLENLLDPIVIIHEGKVLCSFRRPPSRSASPRERLPALEGRQVVYAEKDALGWTALLPGRGGSGVDLEFAFNAAIAEPDKFRAAVGAPVGEAAE